jgi:integrase
VRFHDGRHTALTRLAEKRQPDWVIQAQMGHVSPAMMRTYSHIRRKALIITHGVRDHSRNENSLRSRPQSGGTPFLPARAIRHCSIISAGQIMFFIISSSVSSTGRRTDRSHENT